MTPRHTQLYSRCTAADPFTAAGAHFRSAMATCQRTGPAFTIYRAPKPWGGFRDNVLRGLAGFGFLALALTLGGVIHG